MPHSDKNDAKKVHRMAHLRRCATNREAVFKNYGEVCAPCGHSDPRALTIDHVHRDGHKHKKPWGGRYSGVALYRWLVVNNFPPGYQTLCANCQMVKEYEARAGGTA